MSFLNVEKTYLKHPMHVLCMPLNNTSLRWLMSLGGH